MSSVNRDSDRVTTLLCECRSYIEGGPDRGAHLMCVPGAAELRPHSVERRDGDPGQTNEAGTATQTGGRELAGLGLGFCAMKEAV